MPPRPGTSAAMALPSTVPSGASSRERIPLFIGPSAFSQGICGLERPRQEPWRVKTHTGPRHYWGVQRRVAPIRGQAGRVAEPQDASAQADTCPWPCESQAGEHVNRPSMWFSHAGIGMIRGPVIRTGSGQAHRFPGAAVVDRSPAGLRACLLRQRDSAPQCGLEPAELLKNLGHAPKDGSLDAGEFGRDVTLASLGPGVSPGAQGWSGPGRTPRPSGRLRCDLDRAVALSRRQLGASAHVLSAVRVSWPGSA